MCMFCLNAHTSTYLTLNPPRGGWRCDMETVNQKSCPSSASDSCQQVTDVFCHQEGQGEHCHYSQLWTRHQLPVSFFPGQPTQALSRGVIQACTDPHSQMKPCMNSSDGRAQSCSLLLPQSLAHSGREHPLSGSVCKAWFVQRWEQLCSIRSDYQVNSWAHKW